MRAHDRTARRLVTGGLAVLVVALAALGAATGVLLSRERGQMRADAERQIGLAIDAFAETLARDAEPSPGPLMLDASFRPLTPDPEPFGRLPDPASAEDRFLLGAAADAESARLARAALLQLLGSSDPPARIAAAARLASADLAAGGSGVVPPAPPRSDFGPGAPAGAVIAPAAPPVIPPELRSTRQAVLLGRLSGEPWADETLDRILGSEDREIALALLVSVPSPADAPDATPESRLLDGRRRVERARDRERLPGIVADAPSRRLGAGRAVRFAPQPDGSAVLAEESDGTWTVRRVAADRVAATAHRVLDPLSIRLAPPGAAVDDADAALDLGGGWRAARPATSGEAERPHLLLGGIGIAAAAAIAAFTAFARAVTRESHAAAARADFVSTVSHELRTPVAVVRTAAETLLAGRAARDEDRDQLLQAILRESERLSGLVGNVLDFARIDAGTRRYAFRQAEVADVVRETVARSEPVVRAAGLTVDADLAHDLPTVLCDPDALGAAVANLLDNAAKFRGASDHAEVRVRATGADVTIDVVDHGLGVSDAEKPRVFERFFRGAGERIRETRGSGIGLALVHHVAEAHGGTVTVSDTPGGGATFTLRLPLAPATGGPA